MIWWIESQACHWRIRFRSLSLLCMSPHFYATQLVRDHNCTVICNTLFLKKLMGTRSSTMRIKPESLDPDREWYHCTKLPCLSYSAARYLSHFTVLPFEDLKTTSLDPSEIIWRKGQHIIITKSGYEVCKHLYGRRKLTLPISSHREALNEAAVVMTWGKLVAPGKAPPNFTPGPTFDTPWSASDHHS